MHWGAKLFSYMLVLAVLLPAASFGAPADEEVARIQKAYEGITDLRGTFVQKSHIKDLKRTDTYNGRFFIKPPKMKWEFQGDKPQEVYITGDDIIIYQKKEKQAFKARFDRATYGQAPIALLGGFGDIKKEFSVSMKDGRLLLTPKAPMGAVVSIEIKTAARDVPHEFPIEALFITDTRGNRVEVLLKEVKTNTGVGDKVFSFAPPEGVSVLEQ